MTRTAGCQLESNQSQCAHTSCIWTIMLQSHNISLTVRQHGDTGSHENKEQGDCRQENTEANRTFPTYKQQCGLNDSSRVLCQVFLVVSNTFPGFSQLEHNLPRWDRTITLHRGKLKNIRLTWGPALLAGGGICPLLRREMLVTALGKSSTSETRLNTKLNTLC